MRAPAPTANSRSSRSESSGSGPTGIRRCVGSQPARNTLSDVCARRILLPLRRRRDRSAPGARQHHGSDGMLENQLFLAVALQDQRILIKTANTSGKFDATQKIHRDDEFFLAYSIQESVLDILRRLLHFLSLFWRSSAHPLSRSGTRMLNPGIWHTIYLLGTACFTSTRYCGRFAPLSRTDSLSRQPASAATRAAPTRPCLRPLIHAMQQSPGPGFAGHRRSR